MLILNPAVAVLAKHFVITIVYASILAGVYNAFFFYLKSSQVQYLAEHPYVKNHRILSAVFFGISSTLVMLAVVLIVAAFTFPIFQGSLW